MPVTLALTVTSWVIRRGTGFFDFVKAAELLNKCTFEVSTLIGMNTYWSTKL